MNDLRVLFLCKKENVYGQRAAEFISSHFKNPLIFAGDRKEPLPQKVFTWQGDLLISFISSWIYPQSLLDAAKFGAINFHPGSPEYPGTGCTNFAIYDGAKDYGVTAHYMKALVDSGDIIAVKRFPLKEEDTVYEVTQRCHALVEEMFYEVMECILQGRSLPTTSETWKRKPYTRRELNELCEIKPNMTEEEITRRIKATTYKTPWAFTRIGERVFKLQS